MTPEEKLAAIEDIRQGLKGRQRPVKALVIEDVPNDAHVAVAKLEEFGVQASWANNTIGVQNYLRENDPYLVFLDLNLGARMDAIEVLGFVRLLRPSTGVIVLTGAHEHGDKKCIEALAAGARFVAKKPLVDEDVKTLFTAP